MNHLSDFKNFALAKHNFHSNNMQSKRVDDEDEDGGDNDCNEEDGLGHRTIADEFH